MRMRLALVAACFAVASLVGATAAQAVPYDLSTDFDTANTPGSAWTLSYSGAGFVHQASAINNNHLFNAIPASGFWGTGNNLNVSTPFVFKAAVGGSGTTQPGLSDADFHAGDVVVHSPNDLNEVLTITWEAPTAGNILGLNVGVWYAHSTVDRSSDVSLVLGSIAVNWTVKNDGALVPPDSDRNAPLTYSNAGPIAVTAGQLLTLTFAKSALEEHGSLAGIMASFDFQSTVPIPAALPLFVSALIGLGWVARRRRSEAA
jgi:hypothetical protein